MGDMNGKSKLVHYVADIVVPNVPPTVIMRFTCKDRRKLMDEVTPIMFSAGLDEAAELLIKNFVETEGDHQWMRLPSTNGTVLLCYPSIRVE